MAIGDIFLGVTLSPSREYVGEMVGRLKAERVFMPCVGRFAALAATVKAGCPPSRIWASDISLFSSLIGYLADPDKSIHQLGITLPVHEPYATFLSDASGEVELAAGILLSMYYCGQAPKNSYIANVLREVRYNWRAYRDGIKDQLTRLLDTISGIHYDIVDLRVVLEYFRATGTERDLMYVFPPFYEGGYTDMFDAVNSIMPWLAPDIAELSPKEIDDLFTPFTGHPANLLLSTRYPDKIPSGWYSVFSNVVSEERIDYIYSNNPLDFTYVRAKIPEGAIRHLEVYNDQEITERSVLSVIEVNSFTGLYYRDLFVHRLGTVSAKAYFLLLVDGRVITSFGIHTDQLVGGNTTDIIENFGVTKSSQRYRRLSKLFEYAITAREFRDSLLYSKHFWFLRLNNPKGIRTTALVNNPNAGLYRGVMQRISKTEQPDGSYKIVFRTDFRDEQWTETLANWLKKHGEKNKDGATA